MVKRMIEWWTAQMYTATSSAARSSIFSHDLAA